MRAAGEGCWCVRSANGNSRAGEQAVKTVVFFGCEDGFELSRTSEGE